MRYLTEKQWNICQHLLGEKKLYDIAKKVGLTYGSLRIEVHHIYRILGVNKRSEVPEAVNNFVAR